MTPTDRPDHLQTPTCKRCGRVMVDRRNRSTGVHFWGCPHWPECKGNTGMFRRRLRNVYPQQADYDYDDPLAYFEG